MMFLRVKKDTVKVCYIVVYLIIRKIKTHNFMLSHIVIGFPGKENEKNEKIKNLYHEKN